MKPSCNRAVASLEKSKGGGTTEHRWHEPLRGDGAMLHREILKIRLSENSFPEFQTLFETKSVSKSRKIFPVLLSFSVKQ